MFPPPPYIPEDFVAEEGRYTGPYGPMPAGLGPRSRRVEVGLALIVVGHSDSVNCQGANSGVTVLVEEAVVACTCIPAKGSSENPEGSVAEKLSIALEGCGLPPQAKGSAVTWAAVSSQTLPGSTPALDFALIAGSDVKKGFEFGKGISANGVGEATVVVVGGGTGSAPVEAVGQKSSENKVGGFGFADGASVVDGKRSPSRSTAPGGGRGAVFIVGVDSFLDLLPFGGRGGAIVAAEASDASTSLDRLLCDLCSCCCSWGGCSSRRPTGSDAAVAFPNISSAISTPLTEDPNSDSHRSDFPLTLN